MDYYYINRKKEFIVKVTSMIKIVIGGLFAFMFVITPLSGGFKGDENEILSYFICFIFFLLNSFLVYSGIRGHRDLDMVNKLSLIFKGDKNGLVTSKEIRKTIKMSDEELLKTLERLFKKNYFQNCSLEVTDTAKVRLITLGDKITNEFITIKCPSCGGSGSYRAGIASFCDYCGAAINGPKA